MSSETTPNDFQSIPVSNWLGETPVWSVAEQALYWINCEQEAELHRWIQPTGERKVWPMPSRIGGVLLKRGGGVVVVLADGVYDFDLATGKLAQLAASPLPPHVKLHECMTDRQGRLWVGGYDHSFGPDNRNPGGAWYLRLDGDQLVPVIDGINVANGLAFSPDGKTIYAGDSPTRQVFACDLDPATGNVSNRRVFLDVPPGIGFFDGATVDAEGGYWLTLMYGSALHRYLPDGTLDRIVKLPFSSPTKVVFGGRDLDTLFIPTTQMTVGPNLPPGFDQNGPVYFFRPGVKGLEDTPLVV